MKICITAKGNTLQSEVDPRFGRSNYFILIETDNMEYTAITNQNINETGGVGVKSAKLMSDNGVEAVLTGACGPNAFKTLESANIKIVDGVKGLVKEVAEKFKNGELSYSNSPSHG